MTDTPAPAEALSARLEAVMEHFETHFGQGNGRLTLDADPELTDLLRDASAALARAEAAEAEVKRLREALGAAQVGIVDFRMDHPHVLAVDGLDRAENAITAALAGSPS